MKKYQGYDTIRIHDIQQYDGLDNEVITHFLHDGNHPQFYISCFGITYPTQNYYIKRFPVRGYILEHIVKGKGYVVHDGKKISVSKGQTYLLRKGENCEYYSDKKDPYQKLWVNFSGNIPDAIVEQYELTDTVYDDCKLDDLFEQLFSLDKISIEFKSIQYDACAIVSSMLLRLAKSRHVSSYSPDTAAKIYNELQYYLFKPFRLETLCNKLFLSKSEIIRYFKARYGVTPYAHLLEQKLSYAKGMLENGNSTVKEISDHLGFSSPYYFSDLFKQRIGVSPAQYRKLSRGI